jgi:hypothetical protein
MNTTTIQLDGQSIEVSQAVANAVQHDDCKSASFENGLVVLHWDYDNSSPCLCAENSCFNIDPVSTYHYGERAIYHVPVNATY